MDIEPQDLQQPDLLVEISPTEVDAGAEITLQARVSSTPPRDLRGRELLIKDGEDALLAAVPFTEFNGETSETSAFRLVAPRTPGEFRWAAVLRSPADGDEAHGELSTAFSFVVRAHKVTLLVWDVPPAIQGGTEFRIKVGVKCSSECSLAGTNFLICDEQGVQQALGNVSEAIWPGSGALRFAEVTLRAPEATGLFKWRVAVQRSDEGLPHMEATAAFGVRFVPPPECLVKVEAFDAQAHTPVKGATVVMHPYRSATDERGVAELRLPRGSYNILVSAPRHAALTRAIEVTQDLTTRFELTSVPRQDPNNDYHFSG
jgi:hypothetical protein